MKRFTWLAVAALAACLPKEPPPPPIPAARAGTEFPVSSGRAWDAVIEHFSANSIPIRTIDRSSGLIVTEPLAVAPLDGVTWAWCGWQQVPSTTFEPWSPIGASAGSYNVLVRGDSTRALVRVTVRWTAQVQEGKAYRTLECHTRDVFEPTLEQVIATRATAAR